MRDSHNEREKKRVAKLKKAQLPKPFVEPKFTIIKIEANPVGCSFCDVREFCNQYQEWESKKMQSQDDE
jgi:hypothetical protein